MSDLVRVPVVGGGVENTSVVPDDHGVGVPVHSHVGVKTGLDVVEEEQQQVVALLHLEAEDSSREALVDKQALSLEHRVVSDQGVDRVHGVLSLDAARELGVVGLVLRGVQHLQALQLLLHEGRESVVGLEHVEELRVAAGVAALQHGEERDSRRLVLVRHVRVPRDVVELVGEHLGLLLGRAPSEHEVELRLVERSARRRMHVKRAEVLPPLLERVEALELEVLVSERNHAALLHQERKVVLLLVRQLAELDPVHLEPQLGSHLSHRHVLVARERLERWVGEERPVRVAERLGVFKRVVVLHVPRRRPLGVVQTLQVVCRHCEDAVLLRVAVVVEVDCFVVRDAA